MRRFWLAFLCLLWSGAAWAAPSAHSPHVRVQLLSEKSALVPGQIDTLAVQFKPDPKWHIYWHFPGEAGLPVKLSWTLPAGYQAGDTEWPYPSKLVLADLVNYVYEDETALLVPITVPASAKLGGTVTLKLHAEWLSCSTSCIPGQADLDLTLPVAAEAVPTASAATVEKFRQRLPVANGLTSSQSRRPDGKFALKFKPITEGKVTKAEFFPDDADHIDLKAPQTLEGSDTLVLTPGNATTPLTGVLVLQQDDRPAAFLINGSSVATASPAPKSLSFLEGLVSAFVGGLILNLMPCVFPVLSLKVLGLVKEAQKTRQSPWKHGLVFALGVLLSFWLIAGLLFALRAGGQQLGWGFQLQSPRFVALLIALFFLISLNLFGIFEVGEDLTRLAELGEGKAGYADAFWSGALATLVATPCAAPFMGAAIGLALARPAWQGMLIFTLLGLGMATPYVLLTSFPALLRWLPRPGAWMETFKQLMAFPMLATAVFFLWVLGGQVGNDGLALVLSTLVVLGLSAWILGRWGWDPRSQSIRTRARLASTVIGVIGVASMLATLSAAPAGARVSADGWQPWTPELVASLRQQHKPVFVDFTASWCLSCKVNERFALGSTAVQQRFKDLGVERLKADWTNSDPAITRALASFGRSGVPLYVYYPKDNAAPIVLPEVLTPDLVIAALK